MAVPYTFGTATSAIPLSQLDSNFATAITIGNTAVQLGNTVTTLNNMTLANVTISSGTITITNVAVTTANVSGTANISTLVVTANASVAGNVSVTGNTVVTGNVTSATHILTGGTANGVVYLDTTKALTTGSALVFDGTNLAVGAASPAAKFEVSTGAGTKMRLTSTADNNADIDFYTNSVYRGIIEFNSVGGLIYTIPSLPLTFGTNNTERMRLDSSGNLGLGVTPPTQNGGTGMWYTKGAILSDGNSFYLGIRNAYYNSGWKYTTTGYAQYYIQDDVGKHIWYNAPSGTAGNTVSFTQAMTLDASGNLLVGTTSAYASGATPHLFVSANTSGKYVGVFKNANATPGCLILDLSADPNNTSDTYIATGQNRFKVLSNGNVQNTNNSYGAISDVKLKENIVDATPKLAGLMQVKVRNYNLIGETTKQIGVVAQELETVFPAMVDESLDRDAEGNDLGTTTKSVKYSVFVPMLIKAIQEQQALIQTLTARITALEGA